MHEDTNPQQQPEVQGFQEQPGDLAQPQMSPQQEQQLRAVGLDPQQFQGGGRLQKIAAAIRALLDLLAQQQQE